MSDVSGGIPDYSSGNLNDTSLWQRVWWWSVLFSPLVVLWSGGLKDLHSDYLQWILQTQNNPFEQLTASSDLKFNSKISGRILRVRS